MTHEQKMINELVIENESLLNKLRMVQAYNKELERNVENLSTTFQDLLLNWAILRHNAGYDDLETERQKYEYIENTGTL
jgi:hypothetical protein